MIGIIGYLTLILTTEHSEAKLLWNQLGSEFGRRGLINNILSFGYYESFLVRYSGFILDLNRWSFCLFLFYIIVDFNRKLQ